MKTKIYNYLLLLSGAAFLLIGCDPPDKKTPELNNQFSHDGQIYNITLAGMSVEDAVYLYFDSGDDIWVYFALHLDKGEYRITKSGTFTFDEAADGTPGTFSEGGFKNKTMETNVISGTVVVNVSGDVFDIKADCKCKGGKELVVRYTGTLEYGGHIGITTFTVNGVTFPYATAYISPPEVDEEYGFYTDIEIDAVDDTGQQDFECYLTFFHSGASLAGTYICEADEPSGAGSVCGVLEVDFSNNEWIDGIFSEGRVTVGIEGDIYTITFEDVKITSPSGLIDVTGSYTGIMLPEPDGE